MDLSLRKQLGTLVLPRYSQLLERLNWSAHWAATIRRSATCPRFATREDMYRYIQDTCLGGPGQPIDYLEFGVFRGHSIKFWAALNPQPTSRFFGFDSFEGLPEEWTRDRPAGFFDAHGQPPDVQDPRVQFIVGWFQQSVPTFLTSYHPTNPLVIHNDSDLYSSTLYALTALDAVIPPGTLIIFDEFYDPLHEYRALEDYADAYARTYEIVAATRNFVQAAVKVT